MRTINKRVAVGIVTLTIPLSGVMANGAAADAPPAPCSSSGSAPCTAVVGDTGGIGISVQPVPSSDATPVTALPDGTTVTIVCQTQGSPVNAPGDSGNGITSATWDAIQLDGNTDYVSDLFLLGTDPAGAQIFQPCGSTNLNPTNPPAGGGQTPPAGTDPSQINSGMSAPNDNGGSTQLPDCATNPDTIGCPTGGSHPDPPTPVPSASECAANPDTFGCTNGGAPPNDQGTGATPAAPPAPPQSATAPRIPSGAPTTGGLPSIVANAIRVAAQRLLGVI